MGVVLTGVGYGVVDCGTAEHNSLGCSPARFIFGLRNEKIREMDYVL